MNHTSILLLDFNPAGRLGLALQNILESVSDGDLAIRQEYIKTSLQALSGSGFSAAIARSNPDVICPVLPQGPLKQMIALLEAL